MTKATHKQAKKSDYFSAGKPVHRLSYCAFLDVLGFSDRIRDSYKDGSADVLLESFHQVLAKSIAQIKESTDESMLYFKSFTDNVVLAHPRFSLNPAVTPPPSSPQAVLAARSSGQCDHRYSATDKPNDPPA